MNLKKLIEPLLNQRGQVDIGSILLQQLISSGVGGLFGLFGGEPRGTAEFSSVGRRGARQAGADEGQIRGLRTALLQRAQQSAFGVQPIDEQIRSLREAFKTASGKNRRIIEDSIVQLESEKTAGGGAHLTQPFSDVELGPFKTRLLPSERETIENQFTQARNAVIDTTGQRGGQLSKSLADLSIERARAVSGAEIDAAERGKRLALSLLAPAAFQESGEATAVGSVLQDIRGQEGATSQALMAGGMGIGALIQQLMKDRTPKPTTTLNIGNPEVASSTGLLQPQGLFLNNENLKRLMGLNRPSRLAI